jgi:hypothetical protein
MDFLQLSNTQDILSILESAVQHHHIIPVFGCFGSGKSHLLQYFVSAYWKQKKDIQSPPRVVYAKLWEPPSKAGNRYATQAACMIFTEITFGLAQISQRYSSEVHHATRVWYHNPRSLYTDSQFTSLFAFVRDELQRLHISAIILDNATEIDIYTLQRLMQCRRLFNHELALIFSARIEAPESINEKVSRTIGTVVPTEEVEPRVEIKPLTKNEVLSHIFRQMLIDHTDSFPKDMPKEVIKSIRDSFWEETKGNWHMIASIERRLRDLLRGAPNRTLTLARWETVIRKTLTMPAAIES